MSCLYDQEDRAPASVQKGHCGAAFDMRMLALNPTTLDKKKSEVLFSLTIPASLNPKPRIVVSIFFSIVIISI